MQITDSIEVAEAVKAFIRLPAEAVDDSKFNALALQLFAVQFERNIVYGNLCKSRHALPGIVEHWTEIPTVPTTTFKDYELSTLNSENRMTHFQSSGTTNQKACRHYHDSTSLSVYETSLAAGFTAHLTPETAPPVRFISLTPAPDSAPHSSLVHMIATVSRNQNERVFFGQLGADGSWIIDLTSLRSSLAGSTGYSVCILGTAFLFVHLIDALTKLPLQHPLPPGSRVMETGGYKGKTRELSKADFHELISRHLGIRSNHIVTEYGMTELSSQAYDRVNDREQSYFKFPHWARARVLSPETGLEVANGEPGIITIVDLANIASVLALQTEDLGIRHADRFELVGRSQLAEPRGCSLMSP